MLGYSPRLSLFYLRCLSSFHLGKKYGFCWSLVLLVVYPPPSSPHLVFWHEICCTLLNPKYLCFLLIWILMRLPWWFCFGNVFFSYKYNQTFGSESCSVIMTTWCFKAQYWCHRPSTVHHQVIISPGRLLTIYLISPLYTVILYNTEHIISSVNIPLSFGNKYSFLGRQLWKIQSQIHLSSKPEFFS